MLDAFRSIPALLQHLRFKIVMVTDPRTRQMKYVQMFAALFGQGSAVYSFGRWSAFLESAPGRLLFVL